MTSHDRAQRNLRVVRDRARGLSWSRIAAEHGITDRQARRIVADYRQSQPALHELDPVEVVEETLAAYEAAIEDLSLLADRTDHDSAKLGAIKARLDVYHARIDLMRTIGVLPPNLGYMSVAIDLRRIAARLLDVFERAEMPESVMKQIMEAIAPRAALGSQADLEAVVQGNGTRIRDR